MQIKNIIVIASMLLTLYGNTFANITKSYSINVTDLAKNNVTINGTTFTQLKLKNVYGYTQTGNPVMPLLHYTFYMPQNQIVGNVTFKALSQTTIPIQNPILPQQNNEIYLPTNTVPDFIQPNPLVYNVNANYPAKQAVVSQTSWWEGDIQLTTIEVNPFIYNPVQNSLVLCTGFEISIETGASTLKSATETNTYNHSYETVLAIKNAIENPQDVSTTQLTTQTNTLKSATETSTAIPYYEYVIIVKDGFETYFDDFINWKHQKGLNIGVVKLSEILSNVGIDEVETDPYVDVVQGVIRQYLRQGFNNEITKYALLCGDNTLIPVKYGYGGNIQGGYNFTWENNGSKIPSDHYYADFNTDWSRKSSTYTGSAYHYSGTDLFDWGTEIKVGRILCTTESEVKNWIQKAIQYEQNPGNGDTYYLTKALAIEADQYQANKFAFYNLLPYLPSNFNKILLSELPSYDAEWPTYPKGADVINKLNEKQGLFVNFTHGGPTGIGTATYKNAGCNYSIPSLCNYNIGPIDSYYKPQPDGHGFYEDGNGLDNLTNTTSPSIMFSLSCASTPFDGTGEPDYPICLGKSFTCVSAGGGPTFIGGTRATFDETTKSFFSYFFNNVTNSNIPIAMADALAKSNFMGTYRHFAKLSHNMLGCPEMRMWTDIPKKIENVSLNLTESKDRLITYLSFNVDVETEQYKIAIQPVSEGIFKNANEYYKVTNETSMDRITYIGNLNISENLDKLQYTITAPGYLPKIGLLSEIYTNFLSKLNIQFETVNSRYYDFEDAIVITSDDLIGCTIKINGEYPTSNYFYVCTATNNSVTIKYNYKLNMPCDIADISYSISKPNFIEKTGCLSDFYIKPDLKLIYEKNIDTNKDVFRVEGNIRCGYFQICEDFRNYPHGYYDRIILGQPNPNDRETLFSAKIEYNESDMVMCNLGKLNYLISRNRYYGISGTLSELYKPNLIQNTIITGTKHYDYTTLIGSNINLNSPIGPVVITSGSNIVFHIGMGEGVTFDKGFEIEKGAELEVIK